MIFMMKVILTKLNYNCKIVSEQIQIIFVKLIKVAENLNFIKIDEIIKPVYCSAGQCVFSLKKISHLTSDHRMVNLVL